MKPTNPSLESNQEMNELKQPHPWLQKHYQEKRERTVRLVKASVDQLLSSGQTVTIEAICRKSIECDPERRGVKKSAILENPEAHAYYRQHSTSYKAAQARKRKDHPIVSAVGSLRIDSNRNVERTRYRYMQLTKPQIIERLLMVEQAYAELEQQQARLQFEWLELKLQRTEVKREK